MPPMGAILVFLAARGALQAARYPALVRATFRSCTLLTRSVWNNRGRPR